MRGRLFELRCRARARLPSTRSTAPPAEHISAHAEYNRLVWRRPHSPRRQRLDPLVVPPLRLGHLGALLLRQHVEGPCRGLCPVLRAHRPAFLGLEETLRGLHVVPRAVEHGTEVVVRHGVVGPQGDGLAEGPGCSAPVLLRAVPRALSQQLLVRVARLRSVPGRLLCDLASPLPVSPHHPPSPSAASSPSCETPRAAAKRQGSPGTSRRRGTSSAASDRRSGASLARRPFLTVAWRSRCKRGSAPRYKARRPRRQRAGRQRQPWQHPSRPSAPSALCEPSLLAISGLAAAPAAWRAVA
eukprot:scaffold25251_cov65-Phaeocystis_antarctica.AAC.4